MKMKHFVLLATVVLLSTGVALVASARSVAIARDVVYGQSGGVDLKLDLARPSKKGGGPFPVVVCIHGGAWQQGNKHDLENFLRFFARHGYVAASVEYRMAPACKWPIEIEDVKCAVRYLRAHAAELNIDPDNIFATGASAGGHLALLLGLMQPKDGLEGDGGNSGQPSTVRGVANFYGPTDFSNWNVAGEAEALSLPGKKTQAQQVLEAFLGTSDRTSPLIAQSSPITYVRPDSVPILSFQGSTDEIVPPTQARQLHDALQKAGVREKLVMMEGEGHGWGGEKLNGSLREALAFFDSIRGAH